MISKIGFIFIFLLFQSQIMKSQEGVFSYPEGYQPCLDLEGKPQGIKIDLDGDTYPDLAMLLKDKNDTKIIYIMRTILYVIDKRYQWFPWDADLTKFEFKNNTLHISSCFGNGRFCKTLLLKYSDNLGEMGDFRLIGYKEESFGIVNNEGAYSKSVNLLTNEYEMGGPKKKIKLDIITLSNIEKYFDFLESIGTTTNNNSNVNSQSSVSNNSNSQSGFNGIYIDKSGNKITIEETDGGEKIKYTLTGSLSTNCVNTEFSSTADIFRVNMNGADASYKGPEFWYTDIFEKCNIDIEPVNYGKSVKVIIRNCKDTKCASDNGIGNVYTKK